MLSRLTAVSISFSVLGRNVPEQKCKVSCMSIVPDLPTTVMLTRPLRVKLRISSDLVRRSTPIRVPTLKSSFKRAMSSTITTDPALTTVFTPDAPSAVGPYSQAIKFRDLLFVSGSIPLDPATGEIVAGGVEEQAEQVLKNLRAVVEASGSDLGKVVKTT